MGDGQINFPEDLPKREEEPEKPQLEEPQ